MWARGAIFGLLCAIFLGGLPGKGIYRPMQLVPVGHTVGIKLFSEGVLVVGLSEIDSCDGACAPAKECGHNCTNL